jgi:archaellum component FlaC
MAIQTKKISDLGSIQSIKDTTVFLATDGGVTGKISFKTIKDALAENDTTDATIANIISELEGVKETVSTINSEVETVKETVSTINSVSIANCESKIAALEAKVATPAPSCDCAEKIAELESKIAALESFVQALQADGYLTLANIKKAAADACPICTHTHEEEQPTE